ncbi:MAG: hypothetical protein ACO1NK_01545 [Sediminibacterium sp.]
MKKILFLLLLFFSCMISFAQQTEKKTIHVTTNPHLKKFLNNSANQKLTILPSPFIVKEYPQQVILLDSLRKGFVRKPHLRGEVNSTLTNTIPVWSPNNDYVFNMPGTFAFDKNQVRVHVPRFLTVVNHKKVESPEKNSVPTQE